eukprot:TRINITY_DN1676_c0_g1_i1.p1 TRINITY_DN1676_c0_g1~~TRINITY_DN1676_c0_g1_i1.p1  ORF type:complete len:471 (-),score=97.05 TRINITY_DN1676_c0_g1_i1:83-1495(-)
MISRFLLYIILFNLFKISWCSLNVTVEIEENTKFVIEKLGKIYLNPKEYINNDYTIDQCSISDNSKIPCSSQFSQYPNMTSCECSLHGSKLDYEHISVQGPDNSLKNALAAVTNDLKTIHSQYSDFIGWVYAVFFDGTTFFYPGSVQFPPIDYVIGDCMNFSVPCTVWNPVSRPWLRKSVIGNKDFIILLDVSQKIRSKTSEEKLVKIISQLLETLDKDDYVSIIAFDEKVVLWGDYLENPTLELKKVWNEKVQAIKFENIANTILGLEEAVNLLKKSKAVGKSTFCQDVILLISNGWDNNHPKDIINTIKPQVSDLNLTIHAFNIGEESGDWLKNIACEFRGSYHNSDIDGLTIAINEALLNDVRNLDKKAVWSTPYKDIRGLGYVTTLTRTIEDPNNGVFGIFSIDFIDLTLAPNYPELTCLNPITDPSVFGICEQSSQNDSNRMIFALTGLFGVFLFELYFIFLHQK